MTVRFKHAPLFTVHRNRIRVQCCCGAQSSKLSSMEEAQKVYRDHVGLRERQERAVMG